jgi:hypothetical protein
MVGGRYGRLFILSLFFSPLFFSSFFIFVIIFYSCYHYTLPNPFRFTGRPGIGGGESSSANVKLDLYDRETTRPAPVVRVGTDDEQFFRALVKLQVLYSPVGQTS